MTSFGFFPSSLWKLTEGILKSSFYCFKCKLNRNSVLQRRTFSDETTKSNYHYINSLLKHHVITMNPCRSTYLMSRKRIRHTGNLSIWFIRVIRSLPFIWSFWTVFDMLFTRTLWSKDVPTPTPLVTVKP